ncbi:MAG: imidazolonepropionase [Pseudomonadota bacterium]
METGQADYGLIEEGAIVSDGEHIAWAGPAASLPNTYAGAETDDLGGLLVTPALIDCHTHLIYGGDRSREFATRLKGASYEDITAAGGGIHATVAATRSASDAALRKAALKRIDRMIADGVSVIEIKSGYGLTIEDEIRMLRIARSLEGARRVKILTTWLAAHVVAKEYDGDTDAYIESVAIPGMKKAAAEGLIDAVDAFCERIAFPPSSVAKLFDAARDLGLPVKLHAEQLSDQKGAVLAAQYRAQSVDHLEYLSPDDASVLAKAGTVAVLLPGAFYTLRETKPPPIEALRAAGVEMAVATDCNPGTSPLSSILLAMNMASTLFGLTPEEALAGTTRAAARALGIEKGYGTIAPGKRAELAVWDVGDPAALVFYMGAAPLARRISAMVRS